MLVQRSQRALRLAPIRCLAFLLLCLFLQHMPRVNAFKVPITNSTDWHLSLYDGTFTTHQAIPARVSPLLLADNLNASAYLRLRNCTQGAVSLIVDNSTLAGTVTATPEGCTQINFNGTQRIMPSFYFHLNNVGSADIGFLHLELEFFQNNVSHFISLTAHDVFLYVPVVNPGDAALYAPVVAPGRPFSLIPTTLDGLLASCSTSTPWYTYAAGPANLTLNNLRTSFLLSLGTLLSDPLHPPLPSDTATLAATLTENLPSYLCIHRKIIRDLSNLFLSVHSQQYQDLFMGVNLAAMSHISCTDGTCDTVAESCFNCYSDCGLCSSSIAQSQATAAPVNRTLVKTVVGLWTTGTFAGASTATVYRKSGTGAYQTRFALDILYDTNFDSYKYIDDGYLASPSTAADYVGLSWPTWLAVDPTAAFLGFSLLFTTEAPAAGYLDMDIDYSGLSSVVLLPEVVPVVAYYDAHLAAWLTVPGQTANLATKIITFDLNVSRQYALFSTPFIPEPPTTTTITPTTTTNPTDAVDLASLVGPISDNATSAISAIGGGTLSNDALVHLEALLNNLLDSVPSNGTLNVATDGLFIQAMRRDAAAVGNLLADASQANGTAGPSAQLPTDMGTTLAELGVAGDVNFVLAAFYGTDANTSNTIEVSLRQSTGPGTGEALTIRDLPSNIQLVFYVTLDSATLNETACRFWNTSKPVGNCDPAQAGCLGAWDDTGITLETLERIDNTSNLYRVVVSTNHMTAFSVGIDFTIEAPDVSLSNFDPTNAIYIWILWASFYAFCAFIYLVSFLERRAYDHYRAAVDLGLAEESAPPKSDALLDVELAEKPFLVGCTHRFFHMFKVKHQWVSLLWPSTRRVYPKRHIKVTAFMATISMAFGMMAIFNYTESQNPGEHTNTWRITINNKNTYLPLEGFYSFFITLPFMLALSMCLSKYSTYLDILRRARPERYRNHAYLQKKMQPYVAMRKKQGQVAAAPNPQVMATSTDTTISVLNSWTTIEEEGYRNEEDSVQAEPAAVQTSAVAINMPQSEPGSGSTPSVMLQYLDVDGLDGSRVESITAPDSAPSAADKDARTDAQVELLDRDMRRYRWYSYALANTLMLAGMALALIFMGSTSQALQERYLVGVSEFLICTAIITAPIVFLIVAMHQQYRAQRQRAGMTDQQWAAHVAAITAVAMAVTMTADMIRREITRALKENLNFSFL